MRDAMGTKMKWESRKHDLETYGNGESEAFGYDMTSPWIGWVGFGHVPTVKAQGKHVPDQHEHAEWTVDLEVESIDGYGLVVHKERSFKTRDQAKAFYELCKWACEGIGFDFSAFPAPRKGKRGELT
jgi:hypothetical protein